MYVDVPTPSGTIRSPTVTIAYDGGVGKFTDPRTLLIQLKEGVVTSVTWSATNCNLETRFCDASKPFPIAATLYSNAGANSVSSDPSFFIAFIGTDLQNVVMKSARIDIWRFTHAF